MGTLLVVIGLLLTFGGLYLVGHEAILIGSLQAIDDSISAATAQSIRSWFVVNLGPKWEEWVIAVLGWPRAPVLVATGVVLLAIGFRLSRSRKNMN